MVFLRRGSQHGTTTPTPEERRVPGVQGRRDLRRCREWQGTVLANEPRPTYLEILASPFFRLGAGDGGRAGQADTRAIVPQGSPLHFGVGALALDAVLANIGTSSLTIRMREKAHLAACKGAATGTRRRDRVPRRFLLKREGEAPFILVAFLALNSVSWATTYDERSDIRQSCGEGLTVPTMRRFSAAGGCQASLR